MNPMDYLNNGLAIVLLIGVGIALVWLARAMVVVVKWAGSEIVMPLKTAAISHLNKTNDVMESVQKTNQEICVSLRDVRTDVQEIKSKVC